MPTPDSFPSFPDLPAELRLKIWSEALSARSVWAVVPDPRDSDARRPRLIMTPVDPVPYLAGLACRESRRVLQESYGNPLRGPRSSTSSGVYWANLENTILYLADGVQVTDALSAEDAPRLRHVVVRFRFGGVGKACEQLARASPALRTFILHAAGGQTLSPELAAFYATILDFRPETSYGTMDPPHIRALRSEFLGDSPPRIHLLSANEANFPV